MGLIVAQLHVNYTEQPRWPFDWDCAHCCSAMFYFLVYKLVLHLRTEPEKFGYHSPNLTYDSLLILSKQLTMIKYTV